jgi:hypothetical protein
VSKPAASLPEIGEETTMANPESPHTVDGIRFFLGADTKQVDAVTLRPAEPEYWYYEPEDYDGDVLWSDGYRPYDAACDAAREEFEDVPRSSCGWVARR